MRHLTPQGVAVLGIIAVIISAALATAHNTRSAWPVEDFGRYVCPEGTAPTFSEGSTSVWFVVCRPTEEVCRNQ